MLVISSSTFSVSIEKSAPSSFKYPISCKNFLYSSNLISLPLFLICQSLIFFCKISLKLINSLFLGSSSLTVFSNPNQNLSGDTCLYLLTVLH